MLSFSDLILQPHGFMFGVMVRSIVKNRDGNTHTFGGLPLKKSGPVDFEIVIKWIKFP